MAVKLFQMKVGKNKIVLKFPQISNPSLSNARKILANTFAQTLGKIVVALLAVFTVKILTGFFGKSVYGKYVTIFEFLAFFGAAADLGLFTIAVREIPKHESEKQKIFSNVLTLRTACTTLAMLLAVVLAFSIAKFAGTQIPQGVAIVALATWLVILAGTFSIVLQTAMKMHLQSIALVAGKICSTIAIVALAKFVHSGFTPAAFSQILWAAVAGALVTFLLTALFARRFARLRFAFDPVLARGIFMQALPFGLALILNTIYFRLDIVLFSFILPQSAGGTCLEKFCGDFEAGSYAVAVRILEVLILIPVFFMNAVLPVLSKQIAGNLAKKIKRILRESFKFLFAFGLAAAIGLGVLARPVVQLIAHDEFLTDWQAGIFGSDLALSILVVPMFFTFLATFFAFALIAFGQQVKLLWINSLAVAFNAISNLWVIKFFGLVGAATTSAISEFLILIMSALALRSVASFHFQVKDLLRISLSGIIMGIFAHLAFGLLANVTHEVVALFATICLAGILFPLSLLAMKVVDRQELATVLGKS